MQALVIQGVEGWRVAPRPRLRNNLGMQFSSSAEPTLLERIAQGDRDAVGACIDTYGALVWSIARRYFRQQADAEDAVQEVFLDLWKSAARYDRSKRSEPVFVAMIARRRVIDRFRSVSRHGVTQELPETGVENLSPTNNPELCAEAEAIHARLDELKPDERQVLNLGIVRGFSHSEIAEQLDMPLGTVKSHMRRGLLRLQEWLRGEPNTSNES